MYLDERSTRVLQELLHFSNSNNKSITEKFKLTRSQLNYTMKKINDWLEASRLPKIERTQKGYFVVPKELSSLKEAGSNKIKALTNYIFSEKERVDIIQLMLLSRTEALSLNHFIVELLVSKATVMKDLRECNNVLQKKKMQIKYTREKGYLLSGAEWQKRKLLMEVMERLQQTSVGFAAIGRYGGVTKEEIIKYRCDLERIEFLLQKKFTDEKFELLPYFIAVIIRRINRHALLDVDFGIRFEELFSTREYELVSIIAGDQVEFPEEERLYLALQLLSTNTVSLEPLALSKEKGPLLYKALEESLLNFERKSCMQIPQKKQLLEKLLIHMRPAYYRIKYHLEVEDQFLEKACLEYQDLLFFVRASIKPLEDYIDAKVPDTELYYLTIFIGSYLIRSNREVAFNQRAIVVCPSGSVVSGMMDRTLRQLLPEFLFYPPVSIREFERMENRPNIIFSPVALKTDGKLFIVPKNPTELEKIYIREQVIQDVFQVGFAKIDLNKMLKIIKKHATIHDEKALIATLGNYLTNDQMVFQESLNGKNLLPNMLTIDAIQFEKSAANWQEAIRMAASPLFSKNWITNNYLEEMIRSHDPTQPYMLIGNSIAIPHAPPEKGAIVPGISILRLEEGIDFGKNSQVRIVIAISTDENKTHLNPLIQLLNVLTNKNELQVLLNKASKTEFYEYLTKISSNLEAIKH